MNCPRLEHIRDLRPTAFRQITSDATVLRCCILMLLRTEQIGHRLCVSADRLELNDGACSLPAIMHSKWRTEVERRLWNVKFLYNTGRQLMVMMMMMHVDAVAHSFLTGVVFVSQCNDVPLAAEHLPLAGNLTDERRQRRRITARRERWYRKKHTSGRAGVGGKKREKGRRGVWAGGRYAEARRAVGRSACGPGARGRRPCRLPTVARRTYRRFFASAVCCRGKAPEPPRRRRRLFAAVCAPRSAWPYIRLRNAVR